MEKYVLEQNKKNDEKQIKFEKIKGDLEIFLKTQITNIKD